MPIRKPNESPPFRIVRVSHVELGVRDLAAARAFYVDCLGLLVTEATGDALYLRGLEERNHHSIVLGQRREPQVEALGFKVASEEDLDRAAFWFGRNNLPTSFPEIPYQGRTLRTADVHGVPVDFYFRMEQAERMLQHYAAYQGARIQRIDHVNCFSPDVQASHDFYNEIGFRTTEYTETENPDPRLWAVWMHRKGNVHDLAFTNGRGPRLHHVGMWAASPMDILHLCDVMATSGYLANMERGPGRHGISNAFFLYVRDPDGHRVELFASDYLAVDPDLEPIRWSLKDPQRQTLWGQAAPQSWFEQGSAFPGVPLRRAGARRAADRGAVVPSPHARFTSPWRGRHRRPSAAVVKFKTPTRSVGFGSVVGREPGGGEAQSPHPARFALDPPPPVDIGCFRCRQVDDCRTREHPASVGG